MWKSPTYHTLLASILIATNCSAMAADSGEINLQQAMQRTLERNPKLVASGFQIQAQQGRLTQSQLRPNPELGIMTENVLGTGEIGGIDSAETTLSLGWVLERGKRESRIAVAQAGVSIIESELEIVRLDAVAETARRFLESVANQERLKRRLEAVSIAEQSVVAVSERVRAGRTSDADLARAEAELARMKLGREDIEHELEVSNHLLAAQWGSASPDFSRIEGDIYTLPKPVSFSDLLMLIDRNPNLSRYVTEQRLREAELHLAKADSRPDWRVSAGVRHLERSNDQAFVAGITIPLTMRNRNQGRIAEAHAKLTKVDADRLATRVGLEARLFSLYQGLQHSLHRKKAITEEILPRIERALKDTQRAYASGRYDYFELQVVQAEVLRTRTSLTEASIDAHKHLIEIERVTGTSASSIDP